MTTAPDIDRPQVLAERLTTTHPDVLRELLTTLIHTLMGDGSRCPVRRQIWPTHRRTDQSTQRLPPSPIRHLRRIVGFGDPQAAARLDGA